MRRFAQLFIVYSLTPNRTSETTSGHVRAGLWSPCGLLVSTKSVLKSPTGNKNTHIDTSCLFLWAPCVDVKLQLQCGTTTYSYLTFQKWGFIILMLEHFRMPAQAEIEPRGQVGLRWDLFTVFIKFVKRACLCGRDIASHRPDLI